MDEELLQILLHGHEQPDVVGVPAHVELRLAWAFCMGLRAGSRFPGQPGTSRVPVAMFPFTTAKGHLPVVPAHGIQLAALAEVKISSRGPFFTSPQVGRKL